MLRNADADDAVQETLLRAWRTRADFEHRSSFGWWLRRIATNACIDVARRNNRSPLTIDGSDDDRPGGDVPAGPARHDPAAVVAAREDLAAAYLVTLRALPPRQRAVLVLREVLSYSAADTARTLGDSVASVNSALQRARATLHEHRRSGDADLTPAPTAAEHALVEQLVHAHDRHDTAALISILTAR
jgi:RNA polymerase sigma-70 factor (ECF subfamily)